MKLNVSHDFLPKGNSVRAAMVMDHFGIDLETGRHVIAEGLELPIEAGDVVLFTGASGSGKSSLMRAAAETLRTSPSSVASWRRTSDRVMSCAPDPATLPHPESRIPQHVIDVDDLELSDQLLIDACPLPVAESMALLSACGLGEAQLLLRRPAELSEGQRYRYRLATALAMQPAWIVADEFSATLDRTLAKVVAFNVRRLAERTGTGFLLATTHGDVINDLSPDVHVRCRLDGEVEVVRKKETRCPNMSNNINHDRKKKEPSASRGSWRSPRRPVRTGRTSLGGITGGMGSGC
jgi:ABC-type ATPase with predicted acetyltransferase domain